MFICIFHPTHSIQGMTSLSERRILRLMKEHDISAKPNNPRLNSANHRKYQYYPNKLKRNFLTDAPNMVWVSDITYAKVGFDFMYLCVVIDLYSRKIVAYRISEYITTKLVSNTFLDAFNSRGKPEFLTFHSDQGSQYTSLEFCMLLKEHNVTQSFSAPVPHTIMLLLNRFLRQLRRRIFVVQGTRQKTNSKNQ